MACSVQVVGGSLQSRVATARLSHTFFSREEQDTAECILTEVLESLKSPWPSHRDRSRAYAAWNHAHRTSKSRRGGSDVPAPVRALQEAVQVAPHILKLLPGTLPMPISPVDIACAAHGPSAVPSAAEYAYSNSVSLPSR